jgi:hypothetical protein
MSAYDTLPEKVFAQIMPGVLDMFTKQGWLVSVKGDRSDFILADSIPIKR